MLGNVFWDVMTSAPVLGLNGAILLAAIGIGYLPIVALLPVLAAYVPAARLVTVLVAALLCFLIGFRVADEREAMKNLRTTLAIKEADLENERKSVAFAQQHATQIEEWADAQRKADDDYIAKLKDAPGCGFEPGPPPARGLRSLLRK